MDALYAINKASLVLLITALCFTIFTALRLFFLNRRKLLSLEIVSFLEFGTPRDSLVRLLTPKGYSQWEVRSVMREIDEIIMARKTQQAQGSPQKDNPETSSLQNQNESQN